MANVSYGPDFVAELKAWEIANCDGCRYSSEHYRACGLASPCRIVARTIWWWENRGCVVLALLHLVHGGDGRERLGDRRDWPAACGRKQAWAGNRPCPGKRRVS